MHDLLGQVLLDNGGIGDAMDATSPNRAHYYMLPAEEFNDLFRRAPRLYQCDVGYVVSPLATPSESASARMLRWVGGVDIR